MIDRLKKYLKPRANRNLEIEDGRQASFILFLDSVEIGRLSYDDGLWEFAYSEEFKELSGRPLADFPLIDKKYKSKVLWPFFSSRIPSMARHRVKKLVDKEGIEDNDLLALLTRFGKRTITNPYVLNTAS